MNARSACAVLPWLCCLACYSTATVGQLTATDRGPDARALDAAANDELPADATDEAPSVDASTLDAASDGRTTEADTSDDASLADASRACVVDGDCRAGLLCVGGACVQCVTDEQCRLGEEPRCDDRGRCVECTSTAQCMGDRVCAPWGECERPCGTALQCTGGLRCDPLALVCLECVANAECTGAGQFCDEGVCRQCAFDTDCRM